MNDLQAVIAAHKKHEQIQDSIVSELRRLADAHAAEMQTSARKLFEAQQRQYAIQKLLGRDDGMVCFTINFALYHTSIKYINSNNMLPIACSLSNLNS